MSNSDGTEVLCNRFSYGINFVEGCASSRRGTGDFVDENRASEATVCLEIPKTRKGIGWYGLQLLIAFRHCFLGPGQCNVVINDKKFDLVRLLWVLSSEFFLRQTEVGISPV